MNQEQNKYEISQIFQMIDSMIKVGQVKEVQGDKASVDLGNGLETKLLKWLAPAGDLKVWRSPTVGESCLVLSPNGSLEAGFILTGVYSTANPAPSSDTDETLAQWSDGTFIRKSGQAITISAETINLIGNLNVQGATNIAGQTDITGEVNIAGALNTTGTITAAVDVIAQAISLIAHAHTIGGPRPVAG